MGASDRRKLWICRFAWTTQTRCPHTHSSDRKKRRKRLEDSFEEEENRNGRRLYTLISTVPGPSDGVHLSHRSVLKTAYVSHQCLHRYSRSERKSACRVPALSYLIAS